MLTIGVTQYLLLIRYYQCNNASMRLAQFLHSASLYLTQFVTRLLRTQQIVDTIVFINVVNADPMTQYDKVGVAHTIVVQLLTNTQRYKPVAILAQARAFWCQDRLCSKSVFVPRAQYFFAVAYKPCGTCCCSGLWSFCALTSAIKPASHHGERSQRGKCQR